MEWASQRRWLLTYHHIFRAEKYYCVTVKTIYFFSVSGHFEAPSPSLDHVRGIDPVPSSRRHECPPRSDGSPYELTNLTNPPRLTRWYPVS